MKTTILAFGIAKDIFSGSVAEIELNNGWSVRDLKRSLETAYPEIKKLRSYMVAVNEEYASDELLLQPGDEIAIIPPVSGG